MTANPSPETSPVPGAAAFDCIGKSFFGVRVLDSVSFEIGRGRVVGLVGENGAGKSTLMNLLGGNLVADSGALKLAGHPYAPRNPNDARAAGIAHVHQELNLFPNLTIAENLHLTNFPLLGGGRVPCLDRRTLRRRSAQLLEQVGLALSPDLRVDSLSAGERQLVEIAKALGADAKILILDEPTTSLTGPERERLFRLIEELRRRGLSFVYISHALGDVLRLCDDLVILRDGRVVGTGPAASFTHDRLVALMVGRPLTQLFPERRGAFPPKDRPPHPLLEVEAVSQPGVVRDVSFGLDAGEILGISGLMGAGRSELARILFGLDPHATGEVRLEGKPLRGGPAERIRRGLAFLTEDRRHEGLCLEASLADNLTLVTAPAWARTPLRWLDRSGLSSAVQRIRAAVQLTSRAADRQPVRTLSGGNQQKIVLGKWLLAEPKVLILDEPTRGIDVGAKFEIYRLIQGLADRGAGILLISSELEELAGLCDRILVLRQGELAGAFRRGEFDRERLMAAALHSSHA